ncbi:MAG: metallophosphoesterase, partial [Kiritimatiellae bacterium]|nr:metallophosphoesterase [Kiritimatiellia bacterium]
MTNKNIPCNTLLTRRALFGGAIAAAAFGSRSATGGENAKCAAKDQNLSVFFSDIHISGPNVKSKWGTQPTYQNPLLGKAVDAVLAMRPLPARVAVFGDIALWFGLAADYETSQPILKRLTDAGIDFYVTTGNHDHRDPLFRFYPRQAEATPVKGRVVSVVDLGHADLFLMDSLKENLDGEGAGNPVDGEFDEAQQKWLVSAAAAAKRPFFVGAHHPPNEVKIGTERI